MTDTSRIQHTLTIDRTAIKRATDSRTVRFGAANMLIASVLLAMLVAGSNTILSLLEATPEWVFLVAQMLLGGAICALRFITRTPLATRAAAPLPKYDDAIDDGAAHRPSPHTDNTARY